MLRSRILREFGIPNLLICLVWILGVVTGLVVISNYESRPGENPGQSNLWPSTAAFTYSTEKPTVVMFVHPHCPCTRASLAEIARVHAVCRESVEFKFVMFDAGTDEWRKSDLVETALSISENNHVWDFDGQEARRFKVKTSGHVLLYDAQGQLLFSGGVTSSRGHEGSNLGQTELIAKIKSCCAESRKLANVNGLEKVETPVFGCGLFDESEEDCDE